ncbi:MAG: cytosine permease, partial [Planctomycetota bacterium]
AIGAVFLPVFTVVLVEHFVFGGRSVDPDEIDRRGGAYWYAGGFHFRAVAAWVVGFLVYDLAKGFKSLGVLGLGLEAEEWSIGSSLPCIAVTAAAYLLLSIGRAGRSPAR